MQLMLVVTGILRRGTHPRYTVGRNRKTHPASYFNIGKVPKGHGALPAGVLVSQGAVGAVEKFLEKGAGETKSGSGSTTPPHPDSENFEISELEIWTTFGRGTSFLNHQFWGFKMLVDSGGL